MLACQGSSKFDSYVCGIVVGHIVSRKALLSSHWNDNTIQTLREIGSECAVNVLKNIQCVKLRIFSQRMLEVVMEVLLS